MAALDGLLITGQSGFLAGTMVASNLGWRPVETLKVGDKVLTFDHAMQTVADIQRETVLLPHGLPATLHPVRLPRGVCHNRRDLWLMPDQGLLVECEAALDVLGDPFAVVPVRLLCGYRGIDAGRPGERVEITTLAFHQDEVIYVEGGLLAHCPAPRQVLDETDPLQPALYERLTGAAARFLVNCLIDDDDDDALGCNPADLPGLPIRPPRPGRPIAANPFG
ncbi:Hint domain-containing protein [Ruegeria pomeroyi]|uniref:Hint domain-containing protein n=1 Tax=Ruegeria pomeroyi TaxID=89184 RepID=A0A9Q3ZNP3_9RHOB|nr:Hint domain-containing protein [Ruegeria pomeroyi]MCE8517904.1 Hint domain-containing protein [Ruegeria pomeroyi]MCE8537212.1 Hint domain-containing protein [Ruegeria pomeroyi]MCE8555535.1 Hint domain-containing protein [Ruegeria pomeroyi]